MRTHILATFDAARSQPWLDGLSRQPDQLEVVEAAQLLKRVSPETCCALIDASHPFFDEDELLSTVAYLRARSVHVAVIHFPASADSGLWGLLDQLCGGLLCTQGQPTERLISALAYRITAGSERRFEYLTLSPLDERLLVVFGDGTVRLYDRPVVANDDQSAVETIELQDEGRHVCLGLRSGQLLQIAAAQLAEPSTATVVTPSELRRIDAVVLGARIRKLRKRAGLTQAEVSRRTGIHRPNIARVENGKHTPSVQTVARLAEAIGVSPACVFGDNPA